MTYSSQKHTQRSCVPLLWLTCILLLVIPSANSETIPLASLLSGVEDSPELTISRLNHTINTADVNKYHSNQNWELFGGAGIGNIEEAVTQNRSRNHTDVIARLGVRYPFMGGDDKTERALHIAEGNVLISEIRLTQSMEVARYQIELAYSQYWAAQTKVTLSNAYGQLSEKINNILNLRRDAGLLLESDRQEFLASFERVNYINAQQQSKANQALRKLRRLTNRNLSAFETVKPTFYTPLQTHPILFS